MLACYFRGSVYEYHGREQCSTESGHCCKSWELTSNAKFEGRKRKKYIARYGLACLKKKTQSYDSVTHLFQQILTPSYLYQLETKLSGSLGDILTKTITLSIFIFIYFCQHVFHLSFIENIFFHKSYFDCFFFLL